MPTLNSALNNANTRHESRNYEAVWMKTKQLGADGSSFCIDDIFSTKEPDNYGRMYWIVRGISADINPETQRIYFKLPKSDKRDPIMLRLRNQLNELKADDENPDNAFHGCYIEVLPATQKGMQDAYLLKAQPEKELEHNGCSCGFILETDHPF